MNIDFEKIESRHIIHRCLTNNNHTAIPLCSGQRWGQEVWPLWRGACRFIATGPTEDDH